jgi:hypothetical protein
MQGPLEKAEPAGFPFVSTGHLPTPEQVQSLVAESHARYKSITEGRNSEVYPALARVPSNLFGVCTVGTSGRINFVSNDRLQTALAGTTATPAQVAEALRVNTESRLRALKIGLLIMAGLALITIIPAGRLPDYLPGEVPSDDKAGRGGETKSS